MQGVCIARAARRVVIPRVPVWEVTNCLLQAKSVTKLKYVGTRLRRLQTY